MENKRKKDSGYLSWVLTYKKTKKSSYHVFFLPIELFIVITFPQVSSLQTPFLPHKISSSPLSISI